MQSTVAVTVEPEANAKARIFTVATSLFAQSGLDAVPLRDIAREAGVNGAAINYYFGTKDELIREIFRKLLGDVNRLRLEALDACETTAKGKKLDPEHVIRALVEPMVRFSSAQDGEGAHLIRLIFQAYGVHRDFVDQSIAEQSDHIALRFVAALGAALPSVDKEEIFWRFDFAVGACQHILLEQQRSHRLSRLSKGLCDTKDVERVIDQLVASILGSFLAKAPRKRRSVKPNGVRAQAPQKKNSKSS
jgi:AcrR family transcriptional regulator